MQMPRSLRAILVLMGLFGAGSASAQPLARRVEIGAHASLLRLTDFGTTHAGIGGRVTVDLANWASVDGEANFFPDDDILLPDTDSSIGPEIRVSHSRRRADAFLGLKLGLRGNRLGAFAKVRPGFARLTDQGQFCVGDACALVRMLLVRPRYRTEFALDLGGGIEFYPSARTVARVEIGDTMIRHRSFAPPCWFSECISHNFASRLGVGFRF